MLSAFLNAASLCFLCGLARCSFLPPPLQCAELKARGLDWTWLQTMQCYWNLLRHACRISKNPVILWLAGSPICVLKTVQILQQTGIQLWCASVRAGVQDGKHWDAALAAEFFALCTKFLNAPLEIAYHHHRCFILFFLRECVEKHPLKF